MASRQKERKAASPPALTHTPMLSTSDFPRREGAGMRKGQLWGI